MAYRRERPTGERIWSVAFTVPVPGDSADAEPVGIVGMTIDLTDMPPERSDHFAVLIDTRPDTTNGRRGLILRHPYWATMKGDPEPPLYYADAVVKWADAAAAAGDGGAVRGGAEYTDPVSGSLGECPGRAGFGGKWLASVQRVRVGPDRSIPGGW